MRSIGIDIGSSQIKVVELQTSSKGFQVVNAYTHQLSQAIGTDLELEIIEYLRDLSGQFDPVSTKFCVALRQDQVSTRLKQFPFTDRIKILKSLPFELEEDLPFSSENAIFDGKIVKTEGNTSEVLACAAPKIHIEKLLQLMKDCAIEPALLTTEGTAFANLIEHWGQPIPAFPAPPPQLDENIINVPRPVRVVINLGHTRTIVCGFDEDHLIGTRSIMWGGEQVIKSIATKYNLPYLEAKKELETKAFILTTKQEASYEAKLFSDLIAKCVRDLIRELQLSLLDFKSEFGGEIIDIRITGGPSGIQGLAPYLTQHLEVPVNKMPILERFPQLLIEQSDDYDRRLGLAIGIAIEGLRKPRNPSINFMRGEFARHSSFAQDIWKAWGYFIQAASFATIVIFVWAFARGEITLILDTVSRSALVKQAQELAKLPRSRASEVNVRQYINSSRQKVNEIRTLESLAQMNSVMDILLTLSERAGDRNTFPLDIQEIFIEDDQLQLKASIRGGKDRVDSLSSYLAGMAVPGTFKIGSIQPSNTKTDFSLSMRIDRGIKKVKK